MIKVKHRYFIVNKPPHMVSQFISSHNVGLLGDINFNFPAGTHAIGRLDNNSEGLLLLTTNKKVTRLLFSPGKSHPRVYLVQVNNLVTTEKLALLRSGVKIRVKGGGYYEAACNAEIIDVPEKLYKISKGTTQFGVHTWLQISITEGKHRQVRKMVAAIRHRCKRLIRISIENIQLGDLQPGEVCELNEELFFEKLNIQNTS
ncbi:MAG: pseudouridine synthase [Ferruginibacter sp.]